MHTCVQDPLLLVWYLGPLVSTSSTACDVGFVLRIMLRAPYDGRVRLPNVLHAFQRPLGSYFMVVYSTAYALRLVLCARISYLLSRI